MTAQKYDAFVRTVELGSLTNAAADLGYTQSGISHMINALEDELGARLLLRDRSGVRITPEGETLLPYIRSVCNSYHTLMDKANSLHGLESGTIRIGTISSISCHLLPDLIKNFQVKHPKIEFELFHKDYADIENMAYEGSIDFGFLRLPSKVPLENIMLEQDRLLVILPENHPLAGAEVFPVEKLSEESFILLEEGSNNEIKDFFDSNNITPNVRFNVKDDYTIMSMVEKGLGISILPELVLHRNPYHIVMKELSIHPYRKLGIVLKNKSQVSAAAKSFINYVVSKFRNNQII